MILYLYTDSDPDHHTIFSSVQISLICLFLCEDFDMLIAMYTTSYHSWTNSAKRIISVLNLRLQGVALVRDTMSSKSKITFAKLDTLEEIRTTAKKNETLWNELLEGHIERLVLHNELFLYYNSADKIIIDEFFNVSNFKLLLNISKI